MTLTWGAKLIRSSSHKEHTLTPRKMKLKRRLEFASRANRTMQERHRKKMKELKSKIYFQRIHQIKYLNQEIARKKMSLAKHQNRIRELRAKLCKNELPLAKELAETKHKLKNAKQEHKRLQNTFTQSAVNNERDMQKLKDEARVKDEMIAHLENEKLCLEETVESLNCRESDLKKDGKTFSSDMRMLVYDSVVNHVPVKNIPVLLNQFAKRSGVILETVPHRSTVEFMTREPGVISDFQAAEVILRGENLTLGFDATHRKVCMLTALMKLLTT